MESNFFFASMEQKGEGTSPDETSLAGSSCNTSAPNEVRCPEGRHCEQVAELGRSNHVKDRFLAILAHELRTPLASMLNAVELLRLPQPGNAIEVIERQAKHMARLVDDILDLSRVSNDKISLCKVRFDLVQAVRETAQAALFSIMKSEHRFSTTLSPEPLWVEADPVRIEQVVTNLLNNAAKYTDTRRGGAQIWLKLTRDQDEALLQVRDEGIGIPADMLDRIFEPFVQLESSLARSHGGLGLGLALVRQLVAMHGGTVTVQSEGPGHGAEFSVRLPLVPLVPSPAPGCGHSLEDQPTTTHRTLLPKTRHRVLVVEDSRDMANTLARLIGAWGHIVKVVTTGSAALEAAMDFRPDIALVDIGLPGVDGYVVASQLSAAPELAGLHILAMSGYGQESDRLRAKEAGFEDYMLKPVDPELLRERLAQ